MANLTQTPITRSQRQTHTRLTTQIPSLTRSESLWKWPTNTPNLKDIITIPTTSTSSIAVLSPSTLTSASSPLEN
jgi:hypothetical protein